MKRIGCIVAFLFVMNIVRSQTIDFQPELTYGAHAGVTLSRIGFLPRISQTLLLQETGGLMARYISEKHFGILVELNFSLRGWKEKQDTVSQFNRYTRSLSYIELPVMTHFYSNLGKRVRIVVNAGPQISFNIGEKVLEKEILIYPAPTYCDNYPVQRKFDYGIGGGLGLEIRTGIGNFILEGRYYFGLSDVFNNTRADYFQSSHNQIISIRLGYLMEKK